MKVILNVTNNDSTCVYQAQLSAKVASQDDKMAKLEGKILQAQYKGDKSSGKHSSSRSHHVSLPIQKSCPLASMVSFSFSCTTIPAFD